MGVEMGRYKQALRAKRLRKNQTEAEQLLWSRLRDRQIDGCKFRRQQPIGRYIVDFVSFERRVVIELDGGQHSNPCHELKDFKRDKWLRTLGYKVLRFWDNAVFENLGGILVTIRETLLSPSPSPSPQGRGKESWTPL